jgi:hypothetical protein
MTTLAPPSLHLAEQLAAADGIGLCVACDDKASYLVVSLPGRSGPCWICAPASSYALACVRDQRSSPWSVVHHTATGTVTVYRTLLDGTIRESVVLCADLPTGASVLCAA